MNLSKTSLLPLTKSADQSKYSKKIVVLVGLFMSYAECNISFAATSPIVGSLSGFVFTDSNNANQTLTSINIKSGWWIDKIQGITNTGALSAHGGAGGDPYTVTWPSNEYLVRAYGKYGYTSYLSIIDNLIPSAIGQISFVTNTGRVLGPYGQGLGIGSYGLNKFDYTVPKGNRIVGFTGRSNTFLNAIGVVYNPIPVVNPAPATVSLPATGIKCANEGAVCNLPAGATASVYYGANGKYFVRNTVTASIACNNATFGDPIAGTGKSCSYVVTTTPALPAADLAASLAQPAPALSTNALSELPVTIINQGNATAPAPISFTMTLPNGITTPLKFSRNADAWLCTTAGNLLTCTYSKTLAAGNSTTIRLPITPGAIITGKAPSPFIANVKAVVGETNLANNNSPALTAPVVTPPPALVSINDPTFSKPILDATTIPKYAAPLPNPATNRLVPNTTSVPGTDVYNLDIKTINAQILPPGFPATPVYAYGDPAIPSSFSYPSPTILANSTAPGLNTLGLGKPVKVKFNDTRAILPHLLPVDKSIHGAMLNEPEIRSIAHLHGIKKVNQNSDGYPEAWISPTGQNGSQFNKTFPTVPINPNPNDYANNQEATALWYHDHSLGITRLNVYAGLAGLYLLRDSNEQTMINNNSLPSGNYELPLVIQDRTFNPDGTLAYPSNNIAVPTAPAVSMLPEFYGNVMVVNGVSWPFLDVEPRRYRFRLLNGSNSRFYTFSLSNNASFQVLGTEGGFLASPTNVTTLTVGPAERYDIIIDFSAANGQTITLKNAANSPFPGGAPVTVGLDDQIMQFRVNQPLSATPNNPVPASLRATPVPNTTAIKTRQVLLTEITDNFGRILPILGTVANGALGWMDTLTEMPVPNTVETWEIFNNSADAHPVHLHGGHFQIVDRQPFAATVGLNNALSGISFPGAAITAPAYEKTWKDTVIAYPGEVTRIKVSFENAGLFVWHCHILEHEDHDMMRPMEIK